MTRLLVPLALMLASCSDRRPPAPTAEQNEQLNEAGAMLNDMAATENARP